MLYKYMNFALLPHEFILTLKLLLVADILNSIT